jgi:predicted MFS family arabinose efflux permease
MVAVIQLAIAFGATAGGLVYDMSGYRSTFAVSAAALCASALLALLGWRAIDRTRAATSSRSHRIMGEI